LLRKQRKTLGGYFFLPHPVQCSAIKALSRTNIIILSTGQYFLTEVSEVIPDTICRYCCKLCRFDLCCLAAVWHNFSMQTRL